MSKRETSRSVERIFLVSDIHAGDSDRRALSLASQLHQAFKPTETLFLGDILDSGWASSFANDLSKIPGQLEKELKEWDLIRAMFPGRSRVIPGNHDFRIVRWLWSNPALAGFKALSLQSLIKLPIVEDGYVRYAQGNFTVTHGRFVRKWSGQSAKAEMEHWGTGGASAHTHRAGVYFARDSRGARAWAECGHLQKNPPHYSPCHEPGPLNWMQAVGTLIVEGNSYEIEVHPFRLSYSCSYHGKRYKA